MDVEVELLKCVKKIGGERVSDTFGESPSFEDADYIFKNYGVISELKTLEEDKISDERNIEKISRLYLKELEANRVPGVVFGTVKMTTKGFSEEFTRNVIEIYKRPIQNSIKKANRQIRDTKKAFNQPDFKGLLIVANNNHSALDPWHADFILEEILRKPDYSSINSAIYFNAGQAAVNPVSGTEFGVWIVKHRKDCSRVSDDILEHLRNAWFEHLTSLKGQFSHHQISGTSEMLANLENKKA